MQNARQRANSCAVYERNMRLIEADERKLMKLEWSNTNDMWRKSESMLYPDFDRFDYDFVRFKAIETAVIFAHHLHWSAFTGSIFCSLRV